MATDPMAGERSAPEQAERQRGAGDWPRPGEEGYVTPDGTPQAVGQLAGNRQAAADRAAAGSGVHGAPSATTVGDPGVAAGLAAQRAESYSGPSTADAARGLTEWVREKHSEVAEEMAASPPAGEDTSAPSEPTSKRPSGTAK